MISKLNTAAQPGSGAACACAALGAGCVRCWASLVPLCSSQSPRPMAAVGRGPFPSLLSPSCSSHGDAALIGSGCLLLERSLLRAPALLVQPSAGCWRETIPRPVGSELAFRVTALRDTSGVFLCRGSLCVCLQGATGAAEPQAPSWVSGVVAPRSLCSLEGGEAWGEGKLKHVFLAGYKASET